MVFTNTHAHSPCANALTIVQSDPSAPFFSEGVHPVLDVKNIDQKLKAITSLAESGHLAAIGECGLDKESALPTARQLAVFLDQVRIAQKHDLPVIVHCVGRWNELEKVIRDHPMQLFVIHGFRKMKLLRQLSLPNVYFSFGRAINYDENIREHFANVPRDRLLLETDDQEFDLAESYSKAAVLLDLSLDGAISLIENNFHRVFSIIGRKQG